MGMEEKMAPESRYMKTLFILSLVLTNIFYLHINIFNYFNILNYINVYS